MSLSIAVVTRRAGVTLTLSNQSHHLVEVRPSGNWLDRNWVEDVVVLDLESHEATVQAIQILRRDHAQLPVVVISADPSSVAPDGTENVLLVPLPMTATTLLATVDQAAFMAKPAPVAATTRTADEPPVLPEQVDPPAGLVNEAATTRRPRDGRGRLATRARHEVPATVAVADPVVTSDGAAAAREPDVRTPTAATGPSDAIRLVRELLPDAALLPRVHETAELIRRRATASVDSDASCVLVQDDETWRVAAGAGLRPLEERLQIGQEHWLVSEIARAGRGVLVRNTDVVRNQLAGAPLASWPDLLALPVQPSGAILLLARRTLAFTRDDLSRATASIIDVQAALLDAMVARRLARELLPLIDQVD